MCELYCVMMWFCQAALGLGLDGLPVANSTAGSRLWKWSGRTHADDALHVKSANDNAVTMDSQRDGTSLATVSSDVVFFCLFCSELFDSQIPNLNVFLFVLCFCAYITV